MHLYSHRFFSGYSIPVLEIVLFISELVPVFIISWKVENADIIKGSGILRLADIKLQVNDARGKNKIHSVEPFHPVQSNFSGMCFKKFYNLWKRKPK